MTASWLDAVAERGIVAPVGDMGSASAGADAEADPLAVIACVKSAFCDPSIHEKRGREFGITEREMVAKHRRNAPKLKRVKTTTLGL
jgi:hypothetical protein